MGDPTRALRTPAALGARSEEPTRAPAGTVGVGAGGSEASGRARQTAVRPHPQARPSCRTDGWERHVSVRTTGPGASAHPRRREPRAECRRVLETPGAPRADGRRRSGGRSHLAVRRRGGRLPRPAAVSPRASPSGRSRSGLGATRRGPEPGGGPRPEMVICCAAANCSNRQGKGEKRAVSFHR